MRNLSLCDVVGFALLAMVAVAWCLVDAPALDAAVAAMLGRGM